MSLLRNYFWWTYERGSLHYDVMVTVILAFLFISPHYINFRDRPVTNVPLRSSEVLVKNAKDPDHMIFEVRAADLHGATGDQAMRLALRRVIEPISPGVTLETYTPVTDAHGAIVAYDATVSR